MFDTTGVSRHPGRAAHRRLILATLAAMAVATAVVRAQDLNGGQEDTTPLRPGEFRWNAGRSPSGPIAIVVDLGSQLALVYRGGIAIGVSTISTGRRGYPTPTGVFQILEKKVEHYSNLYDDAPMPYMQRLTWGGLSMHAGRLPGYPASHGCIRLPLEFAKLLYGITTFTTTVVIVDRHADPWETPVPGETGGGTEVPAPHEAFSSQGGC